MPALLDALEIRDVDTLLSRLLGKAKCLGIDVEGGSGAGENYGSTFLRLRARVRDDSRPEGEKEFSIPMVCKMLPPTAYLREIFVVDVSFKKEAQFYTEVVPAWETLQDELGIPASERINLFAKLYGVRGGSKEESVDDESILVLENLVESGGFEIGNRMEGLDLAHSKVAVQGLAKFHALGIALKKKKPDVFWGPVNDAAVSVQAKFSMEKRIEDYTRFASSTVKLLETVPELHPHLDVLRKTLLNPDGAKDPPRREPFTTFVHRDFWTNNFMFAYDKDGKPNALKMVDFQLSALGSPAGDLIFFLCCSTNSEVFRSNFDELLKEYHDSFYRYLELHGVACEELGWKAFLEDVNLGAPAQVRTVYLMTNIIMSENKVELSDVNSDSIFTDTLGCSRAAAMRLLAVTEELLRRGWLNE